MQNPITFSIILPTYNRATMLKASIGSVQNQTYSNWELIIVDDGSSDNTAEVVAEIKADDDRIKYFYQENAERSAARNNGISKADGDYICFLDSDDRFASNHLEGLISEINKHQSKEFVYISKSTVINKGGETKIDIIKGENDYETVLLNSITPGQICVAKEIIQNNTFNEKIRISEDTELLFRLIGLAPLCILNQYTFLYHQHDDNSVNPNKYNAYFERKKTLELIFTYAEAKNVSNKLKRKVLSNCYFGIVKFYVAQQKFWKARLTLLEAIIFYPEIRIKEKIYLLFNLTKS